MKRNSLSRCSAGSLALAGLAGGKLHAGIGFGFGIGIGFGFGFGFGIGFGFGLDDSTNTGPRHKSQRFWKSHKKSVAEKGIPIPSQDKEDKGKSNHSVLQLKQLLFSVQCDGTIRSKSMGMANTAHPHCNLYSPFDPFNIV